MKLRMQRIKTYYNYYDSKKIYFSNNSSRCCLFEKKDLKDHHSCQLLSRNPIVTYSKTGVVIYSWKNR